MDRIFTIIIYSNEGKLKASKEYDYYDLLEEKQN